MVVKINDLIFKFLAKKGKLGRIIKKQFNKQTYRSIQRQKFRVQISNRFDQGRL